MHVDFLNLCDLALALSYLTKQGVAFFVCSNHLKEKRLTIIQIIKRLYCCPTRIRTQTNRTKICCATITQWDNHIAKVVLLFENAIQMHRFCA